MKTEKDFSVLYLERQLCFPLYAASRLTTKIYEPFLKNLDLTYPQYLVLSVLWQNDAITVNEIGSRLFLESNTLTPLLKRLEQKGLLTRKRSAEDERKVVISLTTSGKALREQAVEIPTKIISHFSDESISVEEIIQFQKTLHSLLEILHQKSEKQ